MTFDLDLVLADEQGREAWRGPLPPHVAERLIADTHLSGVVAGRLPNDAAPVRVDRFALADTGEGTRLRIAVGAGNASFEKTYLPARALRDDAEVLLARLLAAKALAAGTYRFRAAPPAAADDDAPLRIAPLPRRLPRLARRSLWQLGVAAPPRCGHPALLLARRDAARLVDHARAAAGVEVGALLVVEPCLLAEPAACPLAVRVVAAVPLAHGTTGTATKLRITPEALAAVPIDEMGGRCRGGLSHSHPFGQVAEPHVLSADDRACATAFFWRPFAFQLVIDPRFTAPEEAIATFCWVDGALARVCCALVDHDTDEPTEEVVACPPSVLPS